MATFVCSKVETSCQEKPDFTCANIVNIVEKKDMYNERVALYKKPIKKDNVKLELDFAETPQELRRQRILHYQKKNRDDIVNTRRGLLEDICNSDDEESMLAEEESLDMDVDPVKKRRKRVYKYANLLMLSEWMIEVPQDLAEKWIMVPCPEGKRCLVVAYRGKTKVYDKYGGFIEKFKSALPGGNPKRSKGTCTVLDCIWNEEKKMFYILDVLAWSRQEMLECETECRFFWVRSQMDELDDIKQTRKGHNDYPFELLSSISCDRDVYDSLESITASKKLDGLLFYHKEAHYTSGKTPLVLWLKPYMLPEVLGMNVPAPYDDKPDDYINFEHHVLRVIELEKAKMERRQQREKRQSEPEPENME